MSERVGQQGQESHQSEACSPFCPRLQPDHYWAPIVCKYSLVRAINGSANMLGAKTVNPTCGWPVINVITPLYLMRTELPEKPSPGKVGLHGCRAMLCNHRGSLLVISLHI